MQYPTYSICYCMSNEWKVVSVNWTPRQASQQLNKARYAEIQSQLDLNPVLSSTSQQVTDVRFSSH